MAERTSRRRPPQNRSAAASNVAAPDPASAAASGGSGADGGAQPQPLLRVGTVAEPLVTNDPEQRRRVGMPADDSTPGPIVVELNLLHAEGLPGAEKRFLQLYAGLVGDVGQRPAVLVANTYYRCDLSVAEVRTLVARDSQGVPKKERAIYRVWPDFPVKPLLDRSASTVKADAARRSYDASGDAITWAVIDSGIDRNHPHFATYDTLGGDVARLHRDFTLPASPGMTDDQRVASARQDPLGHGTHVAGIIAGGLPAGLPESAPRPADFKYCVGQRVSASDEIDVERIEGRTVSAPGRLTGVAPRCKLVSLRVLDDNGQSRSTDVIRALEYVREDLNGNGKLLRVHGVNLSLGYEFNAKWFACGQSPICVEVDRLVRSGVVVVVAAGNTGYGDLTTREGLTSTSLGLTINDPGNAAMAITVGSTHRDSPHTYGVSYFSSKGPTGDGRLKPDLVAPGERVTSCAAGRRRADMLQDMAAALKEIWGDTVPPDAALYIDDSGTSMAAPHVSGAIAAFLSIRREFIGRTEEIKRIFLENATSLGRERYFEGHGLVDLMRAIQAV